MEFTLKKHLAIAALSLAAVFASNAQAATYNLAGSGGNLGGSEGFAATVGTGPTMTATAGANVLTVGIPASLVQSAAGLGVTRFLDGNPTQVDGSPLLTSEYITFSFAWAVKLLSFDLMGIDANDNYDISINGGGFINSLTALTSNLVDINNVNFFTIRASGTAFQDGFLGNDEFSLKSVNVASVPLPAAGLLLLGALGGLSALRRRKATFA